MPADGAGAVTLAYLHTDSVSHSWHMSLFAAMSHDIAGSQRLARGGFIAMRCGSGGLVKGRNDATAMFRESDTEWLLWVDTDMGFAPDAVDRLVEAADPIDRPVMGALCFVQQEYAPDGMGGFLTRPVPTLYDWAGGPDGRAGFHPVDDYPRDQVVQVAATGSAFVLIHRSVIETLHAEHGPAWYTRAGNARTGQLLSEDLSFAARCGGAKIPIHVHTGVRTSHHKPVWLSEVDFDLRLKATAAPAEEAAHV